MSVLTIVEASKQFNVTRPRIYRAIKKGELSTVLNDEGVQVVQVQDMIRLFDNQKKKTVPKPVRNNVHDTDLKLVKFLEEQLRKSEEDKAFLKQQINDLRKDFEDYKLRIEHHPQTEAVTSVTSNDHVAKDVSLQIEQHENVQNPKQEFEQETPQSNIEKKGLLRRLVGELLR